MGTLSVRNLGKAYKKYPSPGARLREWLTPFGAPRHEKTWVLKDISFDIKPGESVGIAGVNGAGKSTLLKLIAGTIQATEGSIHHEGRVAALLELGMGFHGEFTGRQNVYMGGQLLGMDGVEIAALMPEIEHFAEIGEAIDRPLRTYSSGMQMRLAFSVATARRPDILIVDEALSVGDAYFQHKSFERIRQFREAGTTLLIVSHDRYALQTICDRIILLDKGRLLQQGDPETVMDYYNAMLSEKENMLIRQEKLASGHTRTVSGTGEASIIEAELRDANDRLIEAADVGSSVTLRVRARANTDLENLVLGFLIKDRMGQLVYGINTLRQNHPVTHIAAGEEITFEFSFELLLGKGNYSITLALSKSDSHLEKNYEWRDYALIFHVNNLSKEDFVGVSWLNAATRITRHTKD